MATNTTNYGWAKPSYEDAADIEVINGTIDNIDAQVKTVETALDNKQNILSSEQLAAVNSGITAEDVAQIETNKNNILSLTQYGGGINKLQITATSTTVNGITFTVNADKIITATGSIADSSINAIFTLGTYTAVSGDVLSEGLEEATPQAYIYARGGSTNLKTVPYKKIVAGDIGVQREYACVITADTVGQVNITFKPMICNSDSYAKSGAYQPYAMSNAELTPTTSTIEYTATAAETWEKTSLSIPVAGKKAVYFMGNVMYNNAEPLGVGIGRGNTFSGTSIMAIAEESAGTLRGALSCTGIYYNNSPSSQTLDLWVKYKTTQKNMITLMYRQL